MKEKPPAPRPGKSLLNPALGRPVYTDEDLRAYSHHLWIQGGMPCVNEAWDEARVCLDANLPRAEFVHETRLSQSR